MRCWQLIFILPGIIATLVFQSCLLMRTIIQNIANLEHTEVHKDVIESCRKGNARAQYQLYQLYARSMYNVCLRMMRLREMAEDMLQESFSDAFEKLDTYRYDSGFGAWLKRIVINNCINEINRRKTDLEFFDDMIAFENEDEADDRDYEHQLSVENIRKAMELLPGGSRLIFSLYLLEGYDHVEISQILNISESNSKSQYMRAKRKVKEILSG
jgi:RNA polymerase sigma factor (sigma-70 family)